MHHGKGRLHMKGILSAILMAALLSLAIGAPAMAQNNDELAAVAAADEGAPVGAVIPNVLVYPASAFTSDGGNPNGFYYSWSDGFMFGTTGACVQLPITFPAGAAKMTKVLVFASDTDPAESILLRLWTKPITSTASSTLIKSLTSVDSSFVRAYTLLGTARVLNPNNAYWIGACFDATSSERIYGAKVFWSR
jgi:hypothetical protein